MSQKRIMFVGTGSGCGKTTVTCALMKALCQSGEKVVPFKCGPDYIDPMFHRHMTGRTSTNLDSFFMTKEQLCWLMEQRLDSESFGIVEGVMGAFDGIGMTVRASSFEIALWTKTPVVLIINAKGMAMSAVAAVLGVAALAEKYVGKNLIRGVILNQVGKAVCDLLRPEIEHLTGIKVLGYFERREDIHLESRHLGLVTADEIKDLDERMNVLAQAAASSIDLNAIRSIACSAQPLMAQAPDFMTKVYDFRHTLQGKIRLGVAKDQAFCFYYEENLELLRMLGVEIVPFSPLSDPLPRQLSGLYIGGGYPELFCKELSENQQLLQSIKEKCSRGLPVIAECGGFMYLHESIENVPMVGIVPGQVRMTKKLGPFGYVFVKSKTDAVFGNKNTVILGHEFHYSKSENGDRGFIISKTGGRCWEGGVSTPSMYAGYPHLYFYSNVGAVIHFVKIMGEYK